MAKRTMVVVRDDLDGTEGARTVRLGLQGKDYEIDLSPEHEEELRQLLNPYLSNARRSRREKSAPSSRSSHGRSESAAIRTWAEQQGMEVPERGRLPKRIVEAYEKAQA